ncbi:hypothetical protein ONA24_00865 [Mycoplasmopsis cynos]|uniref:hypothetical protein n=1 Tax=Mycoplasmopsis cynos TaxID=171284 RepID=UPI0024C84201|nr:hypothetical protein [Mycoplasmopsis cynos]WAM09888.1 hypothetical protein ONA24_00865 [Mycoplasmopsis cynos]
MGLIKIDFLALKNLTFISEIEKLVPSIQLFDNIVNDSISLFNDKKSFDILNSLYTDGIFQLESPGMRNAIKQVGISSFDDIYAIISLFRPDPSMYIPIYAKCKKNDLFIEKVHPKYDNIVKNTYGIIVYQEQIMQIVQDVARMPFSTRDLFRRAISKKDDTKLQMYKAEFFQGALRTDWYLRTCKKYIQTLKNLLHMVLINLVRCCLCIN